MNVLVTGGAGYIGSACVQELIEQNHTVTVFDNLSEGHRAAVHPAANFVEGCLNQAEQSKDVVGRAAPEVVIHFAASALVEESMKVPGKYFGNNVANGLNLLNACVQAQVRKIVFSSTCATYGIPDRIPISEDTPQQPINPYGESKLIFEKMLRWFHEIHGLQYVAFRYFNACGATDRFGEHHRIETHLIPNVLKVALKQQTSCKIFGTDYPTTDGTCVRDYIHIKDLATAHILASQSNLNGCYNLGTGKGYSVREVIAACELLTGAKIAVEEHDRRPGDPPKLVAAPSQAINALNWHPEFIAIERIVDTAWQWHKAHPNGYPH
ncbi:MAG: UDP-glucose 4-epimerase [Verrucomicrobia subdivision 3 bacterium]|nr:UDP-glucose 4-epimerase [Limisphaerales bacterium]MCS1414221.1 UDP-glucose 4-epimerase [Limisphaerales bacterium]